MNQPILSIVTVTYRDVVGLTRTLRSLRPLCAVAGTEISVHVVDGGSGPSVHTAVSTSGLGVDLVSEGDSGIYDAMNKGLARSTGDYVWFLNGGDVCTVTEWADLRKLLGPHLDLVFCSYQLDLGRRLVTRRPRGTNFIRHGLPTSHQAIFFPRAATAAIGYDTSYQITGDYQLTAALLQSGVQARPSRLTVARFAAGGRSQVHARLLTQEASRVQRSVLHLPRRRVVASRARHHVSRVVRTLLTSGTTSTIGPDAVHG
jgi:putative colanic acid biosynthesis glycosyltransferase